MVMRCQSIAGEETEGVRGFWGNLSRGRILEGVGKKLVSKTEILYGDFY